MGFSGVQSFCNAVKRAFYGGHLIAKGRSNVSLRQASRGALRHLQDHDLALDARPGLSRTGSAFTRRHPLAAVGRSGMGSRARGLIHERPT